MVVLLLLDKELLSYNKRATISRHNYSRWRRPGNLKTKLQNVAPRLTKIVMKIHETVGVVSRYLSGYLSTAWILLTRDNLDGKMFTFVTHFGENKLWKQQNLVLSLTRIDFAVAVSSRAVHISSRAVLVFPALSLQRVRPSCGSFSLMVFQGNCARGRTDHVIRELMT